VPLVRNLAALDRLVCDAQHRSMAFFSGKMRIVIRACDAEDGYKSSFFSKWTVSRNPTIGLTGSKLHASVASTT
jgi:hypothetical protein